MERNHLHAHAESSHDQLSTSSTFTINSTCFLLCQGVMRESDHESARLSVVQLLLTLQSTVNAALLSMKSESLVLSHRGLV